MNDAQSTKAIVIAGAGYAGLRTALRLGSRLGTRRDVSLTMVDRHDYHQLLTELPRIVSGSRSGDEVRVPLDTVLERNVSFVQTTVTGFDLPAKQLLTESGPIPYWRLVLALGSRPNDFAIPGLAERVLHLWSADEADTVRNTINDVVKQATVASDAAEQRRLLTIVIGGGGATGVELAGELAEELPALLADHGIRRSQWRVILVEAGHTILAGSSPGLISRAETILRDLHVEIRTNAAIGEATQEGFKLKSGEVIEGGVFIWAGGVKAPEVLAGSGLSLGYNDRVKVDQYLRALDYPEIYAAGDSASAIDPSTGRALQPLAQIALDEGETVARNVEAELEGKDLRPFHFHNKGFVVSVGGRRGVADLPGVTIGGRLAHALKDAIEWEYRQSVQHLRGWSPV